MGLKAEKARTTGLIVIMNKCIMQITSNTFIKLLIIIEDFITTLSNGLQQIKKGFSW